MLKYAAVMILLFCLQSVSYADTRQPIPSYMKPHIMVLSLSSDGQYAISTDGYQHAVLWNLQKHTSQIIARHVNIYSAYFVKNSHDYMYQLNGSNDVVVKNIQGKTVKQFNPGFASYGNTITSDLKSYFGVTVNWEVYKFSINQNKRHQILNQFCSLDHRHEKIPQGAIDGCSSFWSDGQPYGFDFSLNDKELIGVSNGGFYIWNVSSGKRLGNISKNSAQTFATISPDGRYVVSGDAGMATVKCKLESGVCSPMYLLIPVNTDNSPNYKSHSQTNLMTIKFIDMNHYLVFYSGAGTTPFPYAGLFNLTAKIKSHDSGKYYTVKPIKYLHLLSRDTKRIYQPVTSDNINPFVRDQAIDTSPSAHVLVMAMAKQNGILVYHYDPKTQTLKQVWAGVVKKPRIWFGSW